MRYRGSSQHIKLLKKKIKPMLAAGMAPKAIAEKLKEDGYLRDNGSEYLPSTISYHACNMGYRQVARKYTRSPRKAAVSKTSEDTTLELVHEIVTIPGMAAANRLRLLRSILNQYPHGSSAAPVQA